MKMLAGCGNVSDKIVLFNKSLYGLEQAARFWLDILTTTLKDNGYKKHPSKSYLAPDRL